MFEDITSGVFGGVGGMVNGIQVSIIGLIGMMWIPLFILWIVITFFGLYFVFIRNFTFIHPFNWVWKVIIAKPYANNDIGLWADKGALCSKNGVTKFGLQKEKFILQRMDTKDIYRGQTLFIISLGIVRKFYARREIDYANHKLILHLDNPKLAQVHFMDSLEEKSLDYIESHIPTINTLIMYWSIITIMTGISSFITIYPLFLKYMGGAKFGG